MKDNNATISTLQKLKLLTEVINQSHHEYLCTKALANLKRTYLKRTWRWNPRNIGSGTNADIEGTTNKGVRDVAAECSASIRPTGTLGKRMKGTLDKLAAIKATNKYYYVTNSKMEATAKGYIASNKYKILVKCYKT